MCRLQVSLQKKLHPSSGSSVMTQRSHAPAEAMVMDEDEELERGMLSISLEWVIHQQRRLSCVRGTPDFS